MPAAKDPHLPLRPIRPQPLRSPPARRHRCRARRLYQLDHPAERIPPPHRRTRLPLEELILSVIAPAGLRILGEPPILCDHSARKFMPFTLCLVAFAKIECLVRDKAIELIRFGERVSLSRRTGQADASKNVKRPARFAPALACLGHPAVSEQYRHSFL